MLSNTDLQRICDALNLTVLMHRLALGAFQQLKKYYYQMMLYGS